jgi:two-component system phosphate regulon sensor histidine kinase PhoR
MSWLKAAVPLLASVALAAVLGSLYGYMLETIILALALWLMVWMYQLQKLKSWLNAPEKAPYDSPGVWSDIFTRIYSQHKTSRDAQARLQSTVNYLQESFAAMRDGVVIIDSHGLIKWFNAGVQPLLGLRQPDDIGQTLTNIVRSPKFNQYILSHAHEEPLQYLSVVEGQSRHLRVEITRFGEGERLLFVRDVSSEVRMEKMRRDFVANVSHELRTPLTVITGYLSTFLDTAAELPQRYVKPLQQMNQQAQRMESLLKDLLWLSRIESEKRGDDRERLDMRGLLQELRDELSEAYPEGLIILDIDTDEKVYGDYRQVYSAVSNLAINAIKYSAEQVPVTIRWASKDDNLLLQVADRGLGIDAVHMPRLTERFYRVDDSRNSATGGTGLGLAIVKHIAAAHGAKLQIESKLGQGSTFTLVFPKAVK